jgi:hypothetical protein
MRFVPAVSLLLLTVPCFAQMAPGRAGPVSQTNNPVSMVLERKHTQTLADGTHINTVTHEYFYRDSLGRTRTENELVTTALGNGVPRHSVFVQDPVARTSTNWQTGLPEGMPHHYVRVERTVMQRPLMSDAPKANPPGVNPHAGTSQNSSQPQPNMTMERLGTEDVLGLTCEASRMTIVFPVGYSGNDLPITNTEDRCISREFGKVLLEVIQDPRLGKRSVALQSVSRGEPDPSLFQPPPDYIDAKSGAR